MSNRLGTCVLAVAALILFASGSAAEVITFEDLVIDMLVGAGPLTEGPFRYQAVSGDGWEIQGFFGDPPSALVTFFDVEPATIGSTLNIQLTDGGTFTFDSVDTSTFSPADSDEVTITGFLGGGVVGSLLLDDPTPDPTVFVTITSPFSGPIDLLQVVVTKTEPTGGARLLDNFTLTVGPAAVPEPSTLALAALGGAGLGGVVRRRKRGLSSPSNEASQCARPRPITGGFCMRIHGPPCNDRYRT
jgi:hypothetical protein